jgi:hypothetical protein
MPLRAGEAAAATFCMPDAASVRLTDDAKSGAQHTFTYDRVFDHGAAQVTTASELLGGVLHRICTFSVGGELTIWVC